MNAFMFCFSLLLSMKGECEYYPTQEKCEERLRGWGEKALDYYHRHIDIEDVQPLGICYDLRARKTAGGNGPAEIHHPTVPKAGT